MSSSMPLLRIFISGTNVDLFDHRTVLINSIMRLGQFPQEMRFLGAQAVGDATYISLEEVRQSDIVILLIAWRYGTVQRNGLSITHHEFREAVLLDKPILVFLSSDATQHDYHVFPIETRDPQHIEQLLAFREEARVGRVVDDTFTTPDDLARKVTASLGNYLIKRTYLQKQTSHISPPNLWNIPYARNPVFTGRESILTAIENSLKAGQTTAITQIKALSGLGGVGKTQVAVEYAYQHRIDYQSVFWVKAETRESLIASYTEIARLLDLGGTDHKNLTKVINWLSTHSQWLLILDNADNLSIIREFLPAGGHGHILLTTRVQTLGRLAFRLNVDTMSQDVGTLFLLRRAQLIAADGTLLQAMAADVSIAQEICAELGGLPLALDQAGAYIEQEQCSLLTYLQIYRTKRETQLHLRGGLVDDHPESVATTMLLSLQKAEQQNPAAADILRVTAFLAPDAIPEKIILQGASYLGRNLAQLHDDQNRLVAAIHILKAYSLIREDSNQSLFSVHRLVQAVIRDDMQELERCTWVERVTQSINHTLPDADYSADYEMEAYLPHMLMCYSFIEFLRLEQLDIVTLLGHIACFACQIGETQTALTFANKGLAIQPQNAWLHVWRNLIFQALKDHQSALDDMNHVIDIEPKTAWLYLHRSLIYVGMEEYQQALHDMKHALELEPAYSGVYVHRGMLHMKLKDYQKALEDLNIAVSLDQNSVWVHAHRSFLFTELQEYSQALDDLNTAVAIEPDRGWTFDHRAAVYREMKDFRQALHDHDRAIELEPRNARFLLHRAITHRENGDYEHAIRDLDRVLTINVHHAQAYIERALIYKALGNLQQALKDLDSATEIEPDDTRIATERIAIYLLAGSS